MAHTASILVVDDNPANLRLLSFLLTKHGYAVRVASQAEEALAAVCEALPDLILMDLQLPGMDGLSLTRKLKSEARTAHIFIVALTAYAMKGDEERALEAGCDAYVPKPIDTRALPGRIHEFLGRAGAQQSEAS